MPHPGVSWQPREHPAKQPHEYIRGGTTKILTLFHPATGQVRLHPATRGTNAVLHPWLRERLSDILAALPVPKASLDPAVTRAAWTVWQAGLTMPFTLPHDLPPLHISAQTACDFGLIRPPVSGQFAQRFRRFRHPFRSNPPQLWVEGRGV